VYEFSTGSHPPRMTGGRSVPRYVLRKSAVDSPTRRLPGYPERVRMPATLAALPDVRDTHHGRDHMREIPRHRGNRTGRGRWLCAEVNPLRHPMHNECIAETPAYPGHFTRLVRESAAPATVWLRPAPPPLRWPLSARTARCTGRRRCCRPTASTRLGVVSDMLVAAEHADDRPCPVDGSTG